MKEQVAYEVVRSDPRQISLFGEEHTKELIDFYTQSKVDDESKEARHD